MKITVILCTYNRCERLAKALESAAALRLPDSVEWEILVVDNNSSDKTPEMVEVFRRRYPERFRYLFEPQSGKSYALNAGIREARGDVLAFMDDDVTVDPTWLENLTAPLRSGEWAGSGGRILPERTFVPPPWLSLEERHALAPLAMFDCGPDACDLTEPPFGTNMAFHKRMFAKYGGFRTDLGPRPGSEIRSEDTEFGCRLLAAGERLHYEPTAVVYHSVPKNRLDKKYFLAWWFDKARADTRAFGLQPGSGWCVGSIPLFLLRRLAVWILRWMFTITPSPRFSCKLKVWGVAGQILECHSMSSGEKSRTEKANRQQRAARVRPKP
jgi:glycosyltransferase involved in cell wall biosynthesis